MGWTFRRAWRELSIGDRIVVTNAYYRLRGFGVVRDKITNPAGLLIRLDDGHEKMIDANWRSWRIYPADSITGERFKNNSPSQS